MSREVEEERLATLAGYGILDTPSEAGFDDIVALAAQICQTPVALVSLVDRDRQWFKARVGFEPPETDLDRSICRHVLGRRDILEIPDLTQDPRTRLNPLVTGAPFLRFYAGAPLVAPDGTALGSLCVIDHAPRPEGLGAAQRRALLALAGQVMAQITLRRTVAAREADRQRTSAEARRLAALLDTQRAVAHGLSELGPNALHAMFQALVEGALRVVDAADGAAVELREGDELVYASVSGSLAPHLGFRLPLERTLSGRALREAQALMRVDALLDPEIDAAIVRHLGVRAVIVAPVSRRGVPIGVLKLQCRTPGAFSARDVAMTQMLAGLVAAAFGDAEEARSHQALREAEDRYRRTFQSVTEVGVVVSDRAGHITEWNTGAERIFGWTAAEIRGREVATLFAPEEQPNAAAPAGERWHLRRDGSRFYASGNIMPLTGDGGEHLGSIRIVRDLTDQLQQRAALEASRRDLVASEARWRGLFETLQEGLVLGVLVRDAAGRTIDWRYEGVNRAWGELIGIAPDQAIGRTLREILPMVDESWITDIETVVETGQALRFTHRGGALGRWYDGVAQSLGEDRFSVIFMEVTERVEADARRAALMELGDALLGEPDLDDMMRATARIVAKTLRAARTSYGTLAADGQTLEIRTDWTGEGVPSAAGPHRVRDLGVLAEALERGRPVVVEDASTDGRIAAGAPLVAADPLGSLVAVPVTEAGRTVALLLAQDTEPRRWREEEIAFARSAADRTHDALERRRAELRAAESQREASTERALLRAVVRQAPMGISIVQVDGRSENNDRLAALLGAGAGAPEGGRTAVHPDGRPYAPADHPTLRALRTGEVVTEEPTTYRDEASGALRRFEVSATPVRDGEGRVLAAVSVVVDVENRWQEEERRAILGRELSHRLKNTLAIVQSIATQTLRAAPDTASARRTLSDRIGALARAHEILLTGHRDAAGIGEIVAGATALHDAGGRIRVEGPPVHLGPRAALSLSLILHELCTNAAKYGALSVPEGRIDVAWRIVPAQGEGGEALELLWREGGGPPVEPPERRSFGTRLIEMGLTSQDGGGTEIRYDPSGLQCRIAAPLAALQADGEG